jgi:hypothetical protein
MRSPNRIRIKYEAKLSNLAARIAIRTNNAALNGHETVEWVGRTNAEVDALQFEIERNQNVEAAPRAALLETLANARTACEFWHLIRSEWEVPSSCYNKSLAHLIYRCGVKYVKTHIRATTGFKGVELSTVYVDPRITENRVTPTEPLQRLELHVLSPLRWPRSAHNDPGTLQREYGRGRSLYL